MMRMQLSCRIGWPDAPLQLQLINKVNHVQTLDKRSPFLFGGEARHHLTYMVQY